MTKEEIEAAKLSKANGIPTFLFISALGANATSPVFYNKTKGEMGQAAVSEKIEKTHILQPSIIGGDRQEKRIGEKKGLVVFKFLQPLFFGKLKNTELQKLKTLHKL
jgi:uncharacterized protein YbjT (DUF2867 family)